MLHGPRDAEFDTLAARADGGTPMQWDRYARARNASFWNATLSFYGPAPVVNARWTHAVERLAEVPGASFADAPTYRFPMSPTERDRVEDKAALGIPSLRDFSAPGPGAADGHMDFAIILPMAGEAVLDALKVLGRAFAESGVDIGLGSITSFHPRTLTFISSFPTMRENPGANRRMRAAYAHATELAAARGWGQYRTHAGFMNLALSAYSFNDSALTRFHDLLKDAVDPNGIISAGRYGIWPKQMRDPD